MKNKFILLIGIILLIIASLYNNQILNFIINNRIQNLNSFFIWISYLGTGFFVFIFMTSLFMWEEKKREWIPTLWASVLVALLITYILKILIANPRPLITALVTEDGFSFPSGHATAVFSTLAVLDKEYPRFKYFWLLFALLILYSRIYIGAHYPTDVIAGALIGFFTGLFFVKLEEKHKIFKPLTKFFKKK